MATIYTPNFGKIDFVGNDFGDLVTPWNLGNTDTSWAFSFGTYANPEKTQITGMVFIPEDYIMKGALSGTTQFSTPKLLNKKFLEDLYTKGQPVDIAGLDPNLERKVKEDGYGTKGVLIKGDFFWDNVNNKNFDFYFYDINDPQQDGRLGGEILGMSEVDGNLVYARRPTGKNTQIAYVRENGDRYSSYQKYKYGSFGEFVGGALQAFGKIPFAPEILFAITKNPVVYATAKGFQVAGAGGDVEDVVKAFGTAWLTSSISQNPYVQNIGANLAPTASAATQALIGSSVTNAAVSGVLASLTGADVNRSILAGATSGALSASANQFTSALLGGDQNVIDLGKAFNMTPQEVATVFTGAFSDGVIGSLNNKDFLQEFTNSLVSRGIGQTTANEINQKLAASIGADRLSDITNASRQVATVASNAALNNQNVEDAVKNAVPGILVSISTANRLREEEKKERDRVAALTTEQEGLLAQIQEAAQREFGAVDQPLQFAQYAGGTVTDAAVLGALERNQPRANEQVISDVVNEDGIREKTIVGINQNGDQYTYTINVDEATGEVLYGYSYTEPGDIEAGKLDPLTVVVSKSRPNFDLPAKDNLNNQINNATTEVEFYTSQQQLVSEELGRLNQIKVDIENALRNAVPDVKPRFQSELNAVDTEIKRVNDIFNQLNVAGTESIQKIIDAQNTLKDIETKEQQRIDSATAESLAANPIIVNGVYLIQLPTGEKVFGSETDYLKMKDRVEAAKAPSVPEPTAPEPVAPGPVAPTPTVPGGETTPGTLPEAPGVPGTATDQDILDEISGETGPIPVPPGGATDETAPPTGGGGAPLEPTAPQEDEIVAPQQPTDEGITDEEILDLLQPTEPEGGAPEEPPPPEEEGPLEEEPPPEEEEPTEEGTTVTTDKTRLAPTLVRRRPGVLRPREEVAQTVSPRVTGEALASILGEKEPLFGGDEDEQRAVWNRRSLRLRRALGL